MSLDTSKFIVLGAVAVNFNGVDLGHTTPNTKVTFKTTRVEAEAGKYGKSPTNVFRNGTRVEVDLELLQTDITNVQASATAKPYPEFTLVSGSGKVKMTFGEIAGKQNTKSTLTLSSFLSGNTPAYDFTLTQAAAIGDPEVVYEGGKVQMWKCKFVGCIDEGKTDGAYIGSFGDASATADAVAPTVSSVVPAVNASGVNVGSSVVWTLSKALNGNTVNTNSVKLFAVTTSAGTQVAGTVTLVNNGASTTITFAPTSSLTAATTYLAVLENEIQDQVGNALATYTSKFATA